MSMTIQPATLPPTSKKGDSTPPVDAQKAGGQRQQFLSAVLNMSWQLAVVVLVPIIGGVQLDKALKSSPVCLFIGLALALFGSVLVMRRTMQAANRIPVPKLTEAQRRAIQKSYEEEDD